MSALASLYGGRRSWSPSGALAAPQIRLYQWVLARLLFLPDMSARTLDGVQGPQTTAALRAYQASERLPQTGAFDERTVVALNRSFDAELAAGNLPPASVGVASIAAAPNGTHTMLATTQPGASRPAAVGTHPKVNTIATPTGTVVVPEKVSTMMPAATVEQLKTMPAAQVQSFVNDLSAKADTAAETSGTGKDIAVTAVPVVGPNGSVTAAISTAPAGWWDSLSDTQKAGVAAGGTLLVIGAGAALWSIATSKGK